MKHHNKCAKEDNRYFCKNPFENNIYTLNEKDITILKERYNKLKNDIKEYISALKDTDGVMLYKFDVILSFLSIVFYMLIFAHLILLLFGVNLFEKLAKDNFQSLQGLVNTVVMVILLCIIT